MWRLVLFVFALLPLFGADALPEVNVPSQCKAGTATLEPGTYHVKTQGSVVMFIDAKRRVTSTFARLEKLPQPATGTALIGGNEDGMYRISSIMITGSDTRIVFLGAKN